MQAYLRRFVRHNTSQVISCHHKLIIMRLYLRWIQHLHTPVSIIQYISYIFSYNSTFLAQILSCIVTLLKCMILVSWLLETSEWLICSAYVLFHVSCSVIRILLSFARNGRRRLLTDVAILFAWLIIRKERVKVHLLPSATGSPWICLLNQLTLVGRTYIYAHKHTQRQTQMW